MDCGAWGIGLGNFDPNHRKTTKSKTKILIPKQSNVNPKKERKRENSKRQNEDGDMTPGLWIVFIVVIFTLHNAQAHETDGRLRVFGHSHMPLLLTRTPPSVLWDGIWNGIWDVTADWSAASSRVLWPSTAIEFTTAVAIEFTTAAIICPNYCCLFYVLGALAT